MLIRRLVRLVAVAGVGISLMLMPLPQAGAAPVSSSVIIPQPCESTHPIAEDASTADIADAIAENWGFTLVGPYWKNSTYRPIVTTFYNTLDAMSCTDFIEELLAARGGNLPLNATAIGGWVAGDYGLTRSGAVSFDFPQLLTSYQTDPGHVARLFVHELAHAYSSNRAQNPQYWVEFQKLYAKHGRFGSYGGNSSEALSEVLGYYVARCAAKNPYTKADTDYYNFAKEVFGGKEFGPALNEPLVCDVATLNAEQAAYDEVQAALDAVAAAHEEARRQIEAQETDSADS